MSWTPLHDIVLCKEFQALQTQQTQMFKSMLEQQQTQEKESTAQMFKTMIDQQQEQQKQVQDVQKLVLIQQQTQYQALMGIIERAVPNGWCEVIRICIQFRYLSSVESVTCTYGKERKWPWVTATWPSLVLTSKMAPHEISLRARLNTGIAPTSSLGENTGSYFITTKTLVSFSRAQIRDICPSK